jgi:hypothetical protein
MHPQIHAHDSRYSADVFNRKNGKKLFQYWDQKISNAFLTLRIYRRLLHGGFAMARSLLRIKKGRSTNEKYNREKTADSDALCRVAPFFRRLFIITTETMTATMPIVTAIVITITGTIITREMNWKTGTLFGIIASAIGTMAKIKIVSRTRREK